MSNQTSPIPPVLETAWKRFADYDNTAKHQKDQYYLLRRWVLYFSIAATFIAIVIENFRTLFPPPLVTTLQIILIAVPIGSAVILAYLSEFKQGQKYLSMQADAEAEQEKIVADDIEMSQEVAGRVQEEILAEARRSMEETARAAAEAGQPAVDDQRLPAGTIFNAALGPAQAVIVDEDEEDAPDGFADDAQEDKAPVQKEEPTTAAVDVEEDDDAR